MIKIHTRLMFPEPGDSGNGGNAEPTPAPQGNNPAQEEQKNPFDFSQFMGQNGEESAANEPEEPAEDAEYKLGFTEADELEAEDVDFFTAKAKEFGLPADGATQFIRAFGEMLKSRDEAASAEAEKALRQEWGKSFDSRMGQVGAYMGRVFTALKMTREQVMDFATPAHFRVFHHIMKLNSEKAAVAAPAKLTPEQQSTRMQELSRQLVQHRYSNNNEGAAAVTAEINRISMEKYGRKVY